jgi:hypothetical protein
VREIEFMIWAAAFANEFARERELYMATPGCKWTIDDIGGFSCSEVADVALEKFREAVNGEDGGYLTPIKENWLKGGGYES